MPPDNKLDKDDLSFFPPRERKMLDMLAEEAGTTPIQYLIRTVRRRALGHLKDLGDDRGSFRVSEGDLRTLRVDEAEFHG